MLKRLNKELKDLIRASPINHTAMVVNEEDVRLWQGVLLGPKDSVYENGIFFLKIHFPVDYPFKPPLVKFLTPVLHPNINAAGNLNLDILRDKWSPALTVSKIVQAIEESLTDPNFDDPLVPDLSSLYKRSPKQYHTKVKQHTKMHAIENYMRYALDANFKTPSKVYSLMALSRQKIRSSLWQHHLSVNEHIGTLPLPTTVKNYLKFADGLLQYA